MRRAGFIFSLDAFVAFTLTMVTISLLIFTISIPKPFYPSFEQAHQLAHDTLYALATSSDDPANPTYLGQILGGGGLDTYEIMHRVAGGDSINYRPIIPKGYGFRLEDYDYGTGAWDTIYNSRDDATSDRYQKDYTKLQASATMFMPLYTAVPSPGSSLYCYKSCSAGQDNPLECDSTPCDMPISNFNEGEGAIKIVRLVVYT